MAGPVIVTTDETLQSDLKASLTQGKQTLVGKLVAVMAAIDHIQKRGRNEFHKYDYATEADIAAAVRRELALRNVMLFPAITGERREQVGEKGSVLTTLDMFMTFHDGDTDEKLSFPWKGAGTDKDDKGLYKAMTGGEKYFLMKTFLIPTGDDPERDDKGKTAEPGDKAVRAAKPGPKATLPPGTAKIIKVVPKSKGAVSWAEVTYVTDTGEERTHPIQADVREAGLSTVEQLCQDNATVEITTAQNSKGKTVIESVQRWHEEPVYVELPPAKPNGAGAF